MFEIYGWTLRWHRDDAAVEAVAMVRGVFHMMFNGLGETRWCSVGAKALCERYMYWKMLYAYDLLGIGTRSCTEDLSKQQM